MKKRIGLLARFGAWLIELDARLHGAVYERTVRDRHGNVLYHKKVGR